MILPAFIADSLKQAHPDWRPVLEKGIRAIASASGNYLLELEKSSFLPSKNRMFSTFSLPMDQVKYILVGEGPYPREESASGYAFMDGAVRDIWSEKGFSKQVNKATSLRNFLKMLLVAENRLDPDNTGGSAIAEIARIATGADSPFIHQLGQLQQALLNQGFLLLNATLVFRDNVAPVRESRAWQPFLCTVLDALAEQARASDRPLPLLILWGKIAERLAEMESISHYPQARSEHPYNLSFIKNHTMQNLFSSMQILQVKTIE
jgi:uracil-DNA glycosylase